MLTDWGTAREYLLICDVIIIIVLGQIAVVFIRYYFKNPESKVRLFFGGSFLALTGGLAFELVSTYYSDDPLFDKLYALSLASAILLFCINVEGSYGNLLKTRYIFTLLTIIATGLLVMFPNPSAIFENVFSFLEFMYLFPCLFIIILIRVNKGVVRKKMVWALVGFLIAFSGVGGTHERFQAILLETVSQTSFILLIAGFKACLFVGLWILLFAFNTDVFLETDWKKYLEEFYVIEPGSATCIYHRNFVVDLTKNQLEKMFTSGIIGIVKLVQEFTRSRKNVDVIDEGSRKILLERGKDVTVVFVARQDLEILRYYLRMCLTEFEFYFGELVAANELGNSKLFSAMDIICDKILQISPKREAQK